MIHILGSIIFGLFFLYSGFNHFKNEKDLTGYAKSKGVPSSRFAVLLSGGLMLLGGFGFVFGMYIQIAAVILLVCLVPITFMMHSFWKTSNPEHKMMEQIQFTKNLAIIGALLMLL